MTTPLIRTVPDDDGPSSREGFSPKGDSWLHPEICVKCGDEVDTMISVCSKCIDTQTQKGIKD